MADLVYTPQRSDAFFYNYAPKQPEWKERTLLNKFTEQVTNSANYENLLNLFNNVVDAIYYNREVVGAFGKLSKKIVKLTGFLDPLQLVLWYNPPEKPYAVGPKSQASFSEKLAGGVEQAAVGIYGHVRLGQFIHNAGVTCIGNTVQKVMTEAGTRVYLLKKLPQLALGRFLKVVELVMYVGGLIQQSMEHSRLVREKGSMDASYSNIRANAIDREIELTSWGSLQNISLAALTAINLATGATLYCLLIEIAIRVMTAKATWDGLR